MTEQQYIANHSYFAEAFRDPYGIADDLREKTQGIEYGSLVGIGLSGSVMIPVLALLLDKPFAILRKPGVPCHTNATYEGTIMKDWLFVDDFISSGETFRNALRIIDDQCARYARWGANPFKPHCVGSYEYARSRFEPSLTRSF